MSRGSSSTCTHAIPGALPPSSSIMRRLNRPLSSSVKGEHIAPLPVGNTAVGGVIELAAQLLLVRTVLLGLAFVDLEPQPRPRRQLDMPVAHQPRLAQQPIAQAAIDLPP